MKPMVGLKQWRTYMNYEKEGMYFGNYCSILQNGVIIGKNWEFEQCYFVSFLDFIKCLYKNENSLNYASKIPYRVQTLIMQNKSIQKNIWIRTRRILFWSFSSMVNCKDSYISDFCGQLFTFRHRKPLNNALLFLFC